jgi:DNA-binding CsgD family transcriptional regulator
LAIDFDKGDRGPLSADAVRAFTQIAQGEDPTVEMPEAVAELEELGVVVRDRTGTNRPVSLDPEDVIRRRLETELRAVADCITRMRALPAAAELLSDAFDRARLRAGGGSEYIEDATVVNARLDDVVGSAEFEILAAQPGGPRTELQLNRSIQRDTEALERGVSKKTLYLATVRDNRVTAEYVRTVTGQAGARAEFRTMVDPFERAIVVDRRVAFISNRIVQGAPEHSAWQVTDPAFVGYVISEFEARWNRADPWYGEVRARGHVVDTVSSAGIRTTPRQRAIMREITDGRDQRAIATRLGISVRTVSDEVTALKDLFDAVSREQLAYKWAFSQDRLFGDGVSEDGLAHGAESAA